MKYEKQVIHRGAEKRVKGTRDGGEQKASEERLRISERKKSRNDIQEVWSNIKVNGEKEEVETRGKGRQRGQSRWRGTVQGRAGSRKS